MKNRDQAFFAVMDAMASLSSCSRGGVGAVFVRDNRILVTGYNGTPSGWLDCNKGGCARCASDAEKGDYRGCNCVHAETNGIATASRHGVSLEQATVYVPFEPCRACTLILRQAGVDVVVAKERGPKAGFWEEPRGMYLGIRIRYDG